jgi:hypothetical protein
MVLILYCVKETRPVKLQAGIRKQAANQAVLPLRPPARIVWNLAENARFVSFCSFQRKKPFNVLNHPDDSVGDVTDTANICRDKPLALQCQLLSHQCDQTSSYRLPICEGVSASRCL